MRKKRRLRWVETHRAQAADLAGVLGQAEAGGVEGAKDDRAQGQGRGDRRSGR